MQQPHRKLLETAADLVAENGPLARLQQAMRTMTEVFIRYNDPTQDTDHRLENNIIGHFGLNGELNNSFTSILDGYFRRPLSQPASPRTEQKLDIGLTLIFEAFTLTQSQRAAICPEADQSETSAMAMRRIEREYCQWVLDNQDRMNIKDRTALREAIRDFHQVRREIEALGVDVVANYTPQMRISRRTIA